MTEIVAFLTEWMKQQLTAHSDQVWAALIFVAPAMVILTVVTQIIKEPIIKSWSGSSWMVRLAVLVQGVLYMYAHALFYPAIFNHGQKVALGVFIGCINIALWHAWDWWTNRKKSDGN
jgi:hypothetical protein